MPISKVLLLLLGAIAISQVNAEDPYRFFTWTVTYGTIYPLGVPQQGILINGQFPGPRLDCVTNDNIIIDVINKLDEPFLITWNGIKQRKNSWQDGVLGTNCPIPPGSNYTYKFQTKDQIGTFTYFPSTAMHRAAGGYGALNVYQRPRIPIPYDPPAGDFTLLVGDWFKAGHKALRQSLDSGKALGSPDGLLINGAPQYSYFTGDQGKTYMFRISNVGLSESINFRIQNHLLKLVEVEGESVLESSQDRNSIICKIEDDCENLDGSHMEPLPCDTEVVYQDEDEPTIRSTQNVINIEGAVVHRPDMSSSVDGNIIDLGDSVSGLSRNDNSAVGEDHCKNVIDLADGNSVVGDSEDYFENAVDLAESIVESLHDRNSIIGKIEDGCENLDGSRMELLPCDTEVVYQDEDEPTIRSTRNVINIDVLEDCVAEAKTNKKALASAMESIVDLTRVAEILEERAQQAKEEASPAGQDIVAHVEALKQMMQHAKQTNDMHAGEVFGEKAILLTEAKELQSRLHNLSDERNKFCSIINEIHETLEARIAAAKGEIAAAEREKLEKEGLAKKALKEQEDLLEAIAQESKKLQQDADENAKLRDFLMDRGRLVDTLQGEMAVIFEDVMLLKNRVEERMPLKGSLIMMAYSSASSSSYGHKSIHSADALLATLEQGSNTGEGAEDQQSASLEEAITVSNREKANGGCREEAIADDEWELLKRDACAI